MKSLLAVIFAVTFNAANSSALAIEPFASDFGKYKIESCEYSEGGAAGIADDFCKSYSQIEVGKDKQGTVRITFSNVHGGSLGLPVELMDDKENGFHETGEYKEYGDFHLWTHSLSYTQDGDYVDNITIYSFNVDNNKKTVFSISNRTIHDRKGQSESHRNFVLTRLP
jgi:hypothetical protein